MVSMHGMPTGRLITHLHQTGILRVVESMGMDAAQFANDICLSRHNYGCYRWSVGLGEGFQPVVHAVPPEEEVGWTPWERWSMKNGEALHQCWVAAPDSDHPEWRWRTTSDEQKTDLQPRFTNLSRDLVTLLTTIRAGDAFRILGVEIDEIASELNSEARRRYSLYRWAVIPHFLADGPVVYALPPLLEAVNWPWESWYLENGCLAHHAHYLVPRSDNSHKWHEQPNTPQRPPEVLGQTWYWDDISMVAPVMAHVSTKTHPSD